MEASPVYFNRQHGLLIHLIEQQKIHMGQRIASILAFFLCQRLIALHQRRKRNMYRTADGGKRLLGQYLLNQSVHEILRIVFRYPLMFLQIYFALLGVALIEHVEHGVDLALDNLKIVIFDVPR